MSAPAATPSSNSPVPPVVSTPPAPTVVATPPSPVSLPPVPVVSSPPPVSPSPPPPTLAPPPAAGSASPPPVVTVPLSPPPPVDNTPPSVVPPPSTSTPSAPPPSTSTPSSPPPSTSTPSPPSPSTTTPSPPPSSTSTPSPPAPAVPSPPPPVQDTPSPPAPVDASPPRDSATPAPPADAVSPTPSKKQRSPPPPSRKLAPPPAENTLGPPSPPFNSPPGPPGDSSPPPLSPGDNTTTPSVVQTPGKSPSPPTLSVPSPGTSGVRLSPPGTSISADKPSSSFSSAGIVGIAIGGIAVLALLAVCLVCFARKKKRTGSYDHSQDFRTAPSFYNKNGDVYYDAGRGRFDSGYSSASDATGRPLFPPRPPPALGHAPTQGTSNNSNFSYEVLAQATNGFSTANMLGEGGFGCVYKGILPGGQEVAVKQLKVGGGQGEREFRAEVEIITRIHHRHLVTLVGYCISETQRLLVYEYVPNGTLDYHLHGKGKGKALLDWSLRVRIAIGAARGLAYLHEDCHPKIIHRDIKSSNILLDNNFEAQVADFGLAKLASDTHTHVTTRVMGTFGYLAPEYASSGKLTDKSDIYSFGVVLLELVTGRKPVDPSQPLGEESLVEWARPLLTQALETENVDLLGDPSLNNYGKDEMLRMVRAAAACIRHSATKRPKMSQVVRALENDSNTGFTGITDSPFASGEYDTAQYSSDLRRFRRMALGTSQEYGSEYSGATSDYGVNPSVSSGEFPSRDWTGRNAHESELPLKSRQA